MEKKGLRPLLAPAPVPQALTPSTHNEVRKQSQVLPSDVKLIYLLTKIICGALPRARGKRQGEERDPWP